MRDIEDAFKDESGRLLLSRTAVSELGERLWADYREFATRDLGEYDVAYLLIDGIAERIRPGQKREPVLAAWGFTNEGRKVLLHLMAGSREDVETVRAFFQDMRARGLNDHLLVVTDGAPGIIRAAEECFPRAARQRCLVHRMRNLAVKVPEPAWPEFKERVRACYQAPSRAIARELRDGLDADYQRELPSAVAWFQDDFEACIAHLPLPDHPSARAQDHESPRAPVPGRAPAAQDHPQRVRREGGAEAVVRSHDPGRRALARSAGDRLRAPPARGHQRRARRRIPGLNRPPAGCTPAQSFQHSPALTEQGGPDFMERNDPPAPGSVLLSMNRQDSRNVQNKFLAQLHFNLANALRDQGRLGEAIASYQRALELNPRYADALLNLGRVLHNRQGRLGEALAVYDRALLIKPDFAEAHLNRGNVLRDEGWLAEALAAYDRALLIKPDFAGAHLNRGNLFKDQARFAEALAAYQEALSLSPNMPDAYSNYLFCLNYDPAQGDAALAEAHRLWGERHSPLPDVFTTYSNSRDPDKPLRVGLVSADFGRHPVGYFLDRVLAAADPGVVQYICYSGRLREDALTERLRAHACGWRSTIRVSDRRLAELIRADGIDILTDLAGHTAGNRLGCFRLRPSPVQVHWVGYCHSVSLMDYSLWDPIQLPVDQERWFVERIVRLPDVRWCYAAPDYAPPVSDSPVLERGYVTFGSFNSLAKVNRGVIDLWVRVLEAVPGSRLLLNWRTLADPNERARLGDAFSRRGLDLSRLELRRGSRTDAGVLGEYSEVDIALDPFPFSGCLTTCEALWMGLPVVTWPRSRPVSRQSQTLLTAIGRTEWVARDAGNYVQIAASLAVDPKRLAALRREQRARMAASPLCDGRRFARNLEEIYRQVWRTFTAGQAPRQIEAAGGAGPASANAEKPRRAGA